MSPNTEVILIYIFSYKNARAMIPSLRKVCLELA